jgi:putative molybdopterin biosynthesis protein
MDKIYTAQDVASELKIKKTTVYELIKRGELKATKVGKQLRISQKQLNEYLGTDSQPDGNGDSEAFLSKVTDIPPIPATLDLQKNEFLLNTNGLIISSQESATVELLRSMLPSSIPLLHSYLNDYNSLYSLYYEKTHLALVDICEDNSFSADSFIKNLLPGLDVMKVSLFKYPVGLYIRRTNPKGIKTLEDLKRSDITMANREKGNCCRMFLDLKLKKMKISADDIQGYQTEVLSHMSLANAILNGKADTGIGDLTLLSSYPQLEGIPLVKSSLYLVFQYNYQTHPAFQSIMKVIKSEEFRGALIQIKS